MPRRFLVCMLLLPMVLLSACSSSWHASTTYSMKSWMNDQLGATPAVGTGYVPMEELSKNPDLPFNKAWIKQGVDFSRYRTIYIAPVNTEYLKKVDWWQETARAGEMQRDVDNLAAFMRTQFIKAFQDDPQHRLRVVTTPEKGSLTLALALTELVPSHVLLNAIKIAGPYGSGLAAAALERGTEAQSTVAFEAKVNDSATGQTVAMFADRQYATARPIDLKGFTWYGNAEDIIQRWAKQFVEVANRRPGQIIKPASNFSLLPW